MRHFASFFHLKGIQMTKLILNWQNSRVRPSNQRPLEYYFLHGLQPGSFFTAILCNQLYSAVRLADDLNYENIAHIATWIMRNAPNNSYGSVEHMKYWTNDTNGCRSIYKKQMEETFFWKTMED